MTHLNKKTCSAQSKKIEMLWMFHMSGRFIQLKMTYLQRKLILFRDLSCSCKPCTTGIVNCEKDDFVLPWKRATVSKASNCKRPVEDVKSEPAKKRTKGNVSSINMSPDVATESCILRSPVMTRSKGNPRSASQREKTPSEDTKPALKRW